MVRRWTRFFVLSLGGVFMIAWALDSSLAAADGRVELGGAMHISFETGAILGKVVVLGRRVKPKPMPVFKNRAFCGATVPDETLLVGGDGGLANAVVVFRWFEKNTPLQPGALTLDNKHCAFTPHVQVGVVGSELLLKNSDPILHTVHARLGSETLFNVGLPTWRQVSKRLERAGMIRINCDVLHTWMSAAIVVVDSPYFALTDSAGAFRLDGLPVGEYEMSVWHERLGARRRRISVDSQVPLWVEIAYGSDQIDR